MVKECLKHGLVEHTLLKSGRIKCKTCQKEYQSKHYSQNKKYYKDKAKTRHDFIDSFVNRVRRFSTCSKCGEGRWWVLDFHHTHSKYFSLSVVGKKGLSIEKIKSEIRKCIVLCSNCHRDLHYQEKILSKGLVE